MITDWKCRWCGGPISIHGQPGIDYVQQPAKFYYHIDCYQQKINPTNLNPDYLSQEDEHLQAIADAIYRYIKTNFDSKFEDYMKLIRQLQMLVKKHKNDNWTYENIYRAFKYYYEVQHGQWRKNKNNSIWIVEYVYDECEAFYKRLENEQKAREKIAEKINPTDTMIIVPRMEEEGKKRTYNLEEWC